MSTTRVLIKQGEAVYRFLRLEGSSDGSLLVFLDRDPRSRRQAIALSNDGSFVSEENASGSPVPSARFSIHTTGTVHRYAGGQRKATVQIEPLPALTTVNPVGFVSIPRPALLDKFDPATHLHDAAATLDIPEEVAQRITFALEIGPKPQEPSSFGVALNYEIYSAVIRVVHISIPGSETMLDHFISGMPLATPYAGRQLDKAEAEIAFHQRANPNVPPIFREESGAYVVLARVRMRASPLLKVNFDRSDLKIEQIRFDHHAQPSHKVRFWIHDKGGRNKKDDLREHILSVELDAEL